MPIVLPARTTDGLLALLQRPGPVPIVVVHANHPREVVGECAAGLRRLVRAGIGVLNQSVLLRGVNDDSDVLAELCERLVDLGVLPYYLHQLDRTAGTAHFEVAPSVGHALLASLRARLPGYAVPKYVQEVPGEASKRPVPEA
jgi:L-lysine 2,3-aminomutase